MSNSAGDSAIPALPAGIRATMTEATIRGLLILRGRARSHRAKPISDGRAIRGSMRIPAIVLNFKTYPEILGRRGWDLAKRFATVAGQTTGWIPPEALLEAGAAGTLINHSERKVAWEEMAKSIPRCRDLGLEVIACADDLAEAETLAKLSPEYIAIEPPELIGGKVSVTSANPEVVSGAVDRIRAVNAEVRVLCGAGVRTRKDVARALELGTSGVLLSSGVVKAKGPEGALRNLVQGLPGGTSRGRRTKG